MKRYTFLLIFLLFAVYTYSQYCPTIGFLYDASGNRIQRTFYPTTPCPSNDNNNNQSIVGSHKNDSGSKPDIVTTVYPNPTSSLLHIEIAINDSTCNGPILAYLYDANAQPVFSTNTASRNIKLDISSLAQGTYFVKVICCNYQSSAVVFKMTNLSSTQPAKPIIGVIK